jgi:hypothetical protein
MSAVAALTAFGVCETEMEREVAAETSMLS